MRILLVEDENTLAQNIKKGLLEENYAVDLISNGRQAFEQASTEDYDLIILDVMLPEMNGIEISKNLRKEKIFIPIIMLTAKSSIEDKVVGLDSGADDYMTKPFSFEELLSRIRSVIRRSNTKDTLLKVGSLELNPSTHIVKRRGKEVSLTGKEYALLEYFMHHPGQILTREQILSHVWDYSYDSMSNIIEVLIRRLRNKIDKEYPEEKQLFSTIRGLGYRLGE